MMGDWRDVAALLLLVHLMTLSEGLNIDGNGAVEEILSKNVSIILIDDKADSLLDAKINNAMPLNPPAYNSNDKGNDSMVMKAAMEENVKILETELEEAIESAALSGQVIMLSPQTDGTNSKKPPIIIIEGPADISQSAMTNKLVNETIEEPVEKLDQEIAQSQNHENYKHNENSENLEDLLAIAEYEPQRIDARRIEEKNLQVSNEQADFDGRATAIRPPAEETHYDVPKRKEYPKNSLRASDVYRSTTTKPDLKGSSTGQVQLAAGPPKLDLFPIDRKDLKAERRQFSSPSTFYHKPTAVPTKFLDDEVNPKVDIPSTAKSSIPRKYSYDLPRNINSLAAPIPLHPKSTIPGSPTKIESPRNIRHLIDVPEPLKINNVHSSRVKSAEISSPPVYRSEYQRPFGRNVSIDSTAPTSGTARASRRVDVNVLPRYVESSNREIQPLTNEQLGFLTRYNLPSLVTGKFVSPRSYPVPSRNSRTGSAEESRGGAHQNDGRGNSEPKNQRRSRTLINVSDSYEINGGKDVNGKHVDHRNGGRPNAITSSVYEPYEEVEEEATPNNHRVDNLSAYQRDGNQPLPSTTHVYDDYEISPRAKPARPSPIASTTPSHDFYGDYKESSSLRPGKDSRAESYEDYRESSSLKPGKDSRAESYEDYKDSAENLKVARNSPSTPSEDYRKIGNSKIVRNTPVDSREDYQESENSKLSRTSPVASREDYQESENKKLSRTSPVASREDRNIGNSKILRNTPIASREDYQESENSKVSRSSPLASYEDYRVTENIKAVKNSPVVSATPVYDFYEDYEESDGQRPLPQPRLIINEPEPPQGRQTNSYPVTIQSRPVQQPTPITLSNNPIYQLHGVKSTSLPVNAYNPYVNYSSRNPSFAVPLGKQNTPATRQTLINQRVTYTTPVYDSDEDIPQANSPAVSRSKITNQNYLENRVAKPVYNGNNERTNSELITPKKKHSEKFYHERGSKQYAVSPTNTIPTLPSRAVSQHRGDLNRANRVSPLGHLENSESEDYEESINRGAYSSETGTDYRNLRPSKGPRHQESRNQVASTADSATFDSHENGDRGIASSTSNRAKVIEPHSADYGNRIRSRLVEERQQDRIVAPSSTHAFATGRRGTGRKASSLNDDERRLIRKHVDEVPVETVNHQASVADASDYEDEVPASSGHEEKHENYKTHEEAKDGGGGDHKHEEGDGEKKEEDHHESHGDKGDKGYKAWHEHDKGEKGHHDKESHDKEYDEKKGEKKKHEEESDYHKEHHHEEKGNKEAEFGEKGEHQKGHSTKGQHVVHKKDEYEKKTEFYDESHEEDGEEKEGEYGEEHEYEKGGHEKIGHHDSGHHEDKYGKKGEHEKGHHYHEHEGHKNTNGHNEHHHHEEKYGKKGGHEEGSKWSHEKGDNGKKSS